MTTALIFAGGTGKRMNSRAKPKQFLDIHGKPVIIYTLEHFEYHDEVDEIVIVCLESWIGELETMLHRFGITKVTKIVPGGETGHDSIYNGLAAMRETSAEDDIVLIHDGVRPMINDALITENIRAVRQFGNAITSEAARESVVQSKDGVSIDGVPPRGEMYVAKAPQSFRYGEIMRLYEKARGDNFKSIDSAHLCSVYHQPLHMILSPNYNVKITEPADFFVVRALMEAMEGQQIYGL